MVPVNSLQLALASGVSVDNVQSTPAGKTRQMRAREGYTPSPKALWSRGGVESERETQSQGSEPEKSDRALESQGDACLGAQTPLSRAVETC